MGERIYVVGELCMWGGCQDGECGVRCSWAHGNPALPVVLRCMPHVACEIKIVSTNTSKSGAWTPEEVLTRCISYDLFL